MMIRFIIITIIIISSYDNAACIDLDFKNDIQSRELINKKFDDLGNYIDTNYGRQYIFEVGKPIINDRVTNNQKYHYIGYKIPVSVKWNVDYISNLEVLVSNVASNKISNFSITKRYDYIDLHKKITNNDISKLVIIFTSQNSFNNNVLDNIYVIDKDTRPSSNNKGYYNLYKIATSSSNPYFRFDFAGNNKTLESITTHALEDSKIYMNLNNNKVNKNGLIFISARDPNTYYSYDRDCPPCIYAVMFVTDGASKFHGNVSVDKNILLDTDNIYVNYGDYDLYNNNEFKLNTVSDKKERIIEETNFGHDVFDNAYTIDITNISFPSTVPKNKGLAKRKSGQVPVVLEAKISFSNDFIKSINNLIDKNGVLHSKDIKLKRYKDHSELNKLIKDNNISDKSCHRPYLFIAHDKFQTNGIAAESYIINGMRAYDSKLKNNIFRYFIDSSGINNINIIVDMFDKNNVNINTSNGYIVYSTKLSDKRFWIDNIDNINSIPFRPNHFIPGVYYFTSGGSTTASCLSLIHKEDISYLDYLVFVDSKIANEINSAKIRFRIK